LSNEQIVKAYRSQYHVEDAFQQMKDTKYLSFRPMHHYEKPLGGDVISAKRLAIFGGFVHISVI
jgi:transposase